MVASFGPRSCPLLGSFGKFNGVEPSRMLNRLRLIFQRFNIATRHLHSLRHLWPQGRLQLIGGCSSTFNLLFGLKEAKQGYFKMDAGDVRVFRTGTLMFFSRRRRHTDVSSAIRAPVCLSASRRLGRHPSVFTVSAADLLQASHQ